jgi:hypothetical protein
MCKKYSPIWEKYIFEQIRNTRKPICCVCSKYIHEPQARCFAHLLAKGMYPQYRLYDANIALVCSPECHHIIDSVCIWNKRVIQQLLDEGQDFSYIFSVIWANDSHTCDQKDQ